MTALAREKVENACDIGTPASQLAALYPQLNVELPEIWWTFPETLQLTTQNYKEIFQSHRWEEDESTSNQRWKETKRADLVVKRVQQMKEMLKQREENVFCIVGHSNYFRKFTGMTEKLANCEIHFMVI